MDLSPRERGLLDNLEMLIRKGDAVIEASNKLALITGEPELVQKVVDYRQAIAEQRRNIAASVALLDPEDAPEPWYTGPSAEDIFWPGLKTALEMDPGWREAVPSLDVSSTDVVGLLADPHSAAIRTRGLVLGHVQSGKTANFTATVAKAADAGYRLFIVLSGVHNALRRQTQLRLEQQLHAPHPTRWLQLTDEFRDFGNPVKALPLVAGTDLRLLAVVKKNVSRLTRLRDWLREANKHGGLDTCPVLIIDDESDQASPNSAKNAELDRTKINQRIVELLELPRVAYIGYTATPFANVLINPADVKDIYPRTFIYSLPKPKSYFGPEELFGAQVSEEEATDADAPHDLVRIVPEDEAALHVVRANQDFEPAVTPALSEAIRWFVLATAARRARAGKARHSSMLIHTTMRVDPQLSYLPPIRAFVRTLQDEWNAGETEQWRVQWTRETGKEPAARHGLREISFAELGTLVPEVLESLKVVADNSRSDDRLIYGDDPATVIAVGGNTLSRGLTLEGLVSSYFLRSSATYDSLLQMGRWFGYRPGYGDLPRIWTTQDLADDFEFLSEVETALRREIDRYRTTEGSTPANLPVRILLHPRMQVTAKVKMQFAVQGEASFSGQRPQTTYFAHRDKSVALKNQRAVRRLVVDARTNGATVDSASSKLIIRDVDSAHIIEFLKNYEFHGSSELTSALLTDYISNQTRHNALKTWNVAVISRSGKGGTLREFDLAEDLRVPLIVRSKLTRSTDPGTANIGTLMSRPDRVADLTDPAEVKTLNDTQLLDMRNGSGRALLLIYPIDKHSSPKTGVGYRTSLDAVDDLIGVALSFPQADPNSEPTSTIQVDPMLLAQAAEGDDGSEDYVDDEGDHDEVDLGDD